MLAISGQKPFDTGRIIYQMVLHFVMEAQEKEILSRQYDAETVTTFCVRHFRGIVIDWAFHNYSFSLMQAMEKEFKMAYQLFKSPRAPMI